VNFFLFKLPYFGVVNLLANTSILIQHGDRLHLHACVLATGSSIKKWSNSKCLSLCFCGSPSLCGCTKFSCTRAREWRCWTVVQLQDSSLTSEMNGADFFTNMALCRTYLTKIDPFQINCQIWPGRNGKKCHVSLSAGGAQFPPPG
jgi:hypothetical protein